MSYLLNKSGFNLDSAEILIKETYFAPSVHCSYYSCVQKMLYIIYSQLGQTEQSLKNESDRSELGSHEFMISTITKAIRSKSGNMRVFNNEINQLKKLRRDSDYREIQISFDQGSQALKKAKEIQSILKESFKV
jgi:hypothetical protein